MLAKHSLLASGSASQKCTKTTEPDVPSTGIPTPSEHVLHVERMRGAVPSVLGLHLDLRVDLGLVQIADGFGRKREVVQKANTTSVATHTQQVPSSIHPEVCQRVESAGIALSEDPSN